MDFFGAQARARQQSRLLTWGFAGCVLAVVVVLDIVVLSALRISRAVGNQHEPLGESLTQWAVLHPGTVLLVSLLVGGFICTASLFRLMQLREGGGQVARSLGGTRVERSTQDPRRRMLHNVVEEMALAAGIPVPEIYVLEQEEGINAFAAGHTPANAAVAVTRGALHNLNRDQLQGVIAHEFSHILNGDMRLSMRLIGLTFGLMAVATAGRMLIRVSSHGRRAGAPVLMLGFGVAAIGQVGFWAGRILQAWISRKRECLADASAVQFTRNPAGLRDALIRAAAIGRQRFANAGMEEVAHMLFLSGDRHLLATHPPLLERVQALDPQVNQSQLDSLLRRSQAEWERSRDEAAPTAPGTAQPSRETMLATLGAAVPAAAALITATTGDPGARHLDHAVAVRQALPEALRGNADDPEQAQALLLSLVIFSDPAQQTRHERQLEIITARLGESMAARVRLAAETAAGLSPMLRLPAVLQLFPALRTLTAGDRLILVQLLQELMRMDGRLSAFDYALEKLALRSLGARGALVEPHGKLGLADCAPQLGVVFAVLATHGARTPAQARHAYEAGMARLLPRDRPAYGVIDDWSVFDQALDKLCALQVAAKQLLIEGLVRTIAHDEVLAPAEAELLRAVCAVLECPLPPVLPPVPATRISG